LSIVAAVAVLVGMVAANLPLTANAVGPLTPGEMESSSGGDGNCWWAMGGVGVGVIAAVGSGFIGAFALSYAIHAAVFACW
jgi:hypothetical protein